jgi:hypothetical protein
VLFDGANPFEASERSDSLDAENLKPQVAGGSQEDEEINPDDLPF